MSRRASRCKSKKQSLAAEFKIDLDLDKGGPVEPDPIDETQKMGDPTKRRSKKYFEKSEKLGAEAMKELSENSIDEALRLFTEAILLNPSSAELFAKRGQAFLKKGRPNACIKDCNRALEINPNSAVALKIRGRAYRLLGQWENARKDFEKACKINFDKRTHDLLSEILSASINKKFKIKINKKGCENLGKTKQLGEASNIEFNKHEWLEEITVTPYAKTIKPNKLREKPSEKDGPERIERATVEGEFSKACVSDTEHNTKNTKNVFDDYDVMAALSNDVIFEAFSDIMVNPAYIYRHLPNPDLIAQLNILTKKFVETGQYPGLPSEGFPESENYSTVVEKAHQLDRRAEALLKEKKYEESIECHKNAIKCLHDVLLLTENPRSRESIQLQIDHHQKQVESLKIKKSQYEDLRRYQESMKNRVVNFDCVCENGETLQHEIFRTIETHDSLIEVMLKRNCPEDYCKNYSSDEEKSSSVPVSGKKRQVDDSILLEEFKGLSEKLREFVQILVLQLEEKDSEIARLKAEIYKLECEKNKDVSKTNNTLKVITDSSGGTSPYVFSPCSELSPEVHDIRGLPSLAPLEMPNFDFSSLVKNTKNLNINSTNN